MNSPYHASIPIFPQPSDKRQGAFDIYSHLLAQRVVFLRGELTEETANQIVAQLLFLDAEDPEQDIFFYINSSGDSVMAGMAVYDTIKQIRADISTVCVGTAASMGAFLLSSGAKGKRFALQNARIMIRKPSGGAQGAASDIQAVAKEILYLKESINRILASNTGRSQEQIERDSERDFFMSAEEAKPYGLVDSIVMKAPTSVQSSTTE